LCFGHLRVLNANVSLGDNRTEEVLELTVVKGCMSREELETNYGGKFDEKRKCWTRQVSQCVNDAKECPKCGNNGTLDDSCDTLEALKVDPEDVSSSVLSFQSETCFCQGWHCNSGPFHRLNVVLAFVILTLLHVE